MARGRDATVRRWLSRFDDQTMLRWPTIAIEGAWVYALHGDPARSARLADIAEVGDEESGSLDGSASIASARAMLRAAMCRHGVDAMRSDAALAYELEPASSVWRPLAVGLLGMAAMLQSGAPEAETLFAEATDAVGPQAGSAALTISWAERASLSLARGDTREAARSVERAAEIVVAKGLAEYATTALTVAVSANVAIHAGDLDRAREQVAALHRLRPVLSNALPWLAIQARLEAARALLGLAEAAGAQTLLVEIDAVLRTHPQMGTLLGQVEELREQLRGQSAGQRGASTLTTAELRLLPLLPTHLSFPEIGERLFISRSTVKTQAISIYHKLGVSSRGAAVERAREVGLLPR
jgi:LuxR family maltose regulon positive regulatory protein